MQDPRQERRRPRTQYGFGHSRWMLGNDRAQDVAGPWQLGPAHDSPALTLDLRVAVLTHDLEQSSKQRDALTGETSGGDELVNREPSSMAQNADDTCEKIADYLSDVLGMSVHFIRDMPWQRRSNCSTGERSMLAGSAVCLM